LFEHDLFAKSRPALPDHAAGNFKMDFPLGARKGARWRAASPNERGLRRADAWNRSNRQDCRIAGI
jgi:hypothetical protein